MHDDYEKLFTYLTRVEPPDGLAGKVMARVWKEERKRVVRRLILFSIGIAASFAALFPAFNAVQGAMAQSGTLQFISLAFSDSGTVIALWNDFIFSILEALPVMSVVAFLTVAFVLIGCARSFIRDIAVVLPRHQFTR